jgi:hypothetical protein
MGVRFTFPPAQTGSLRRGGQKENCLSFVWQELYVVFSLDKLHPENEK